MPRWFQAENEEYQPIHISERGACTERRLGRQHPELDLVAVVAHHVQKEVERALFALSQALTKVRTPDYGSGGLHTPCTLTT